MRGIIQQLELFNSKERFFVVKQCLGNSCFSLSEKFRNDLSIILNLNIPKDAFSAMDYHLDWVYACLRIASEKEGNKEIFLNDEGLIKGQQEDIDFLIAFETKNKTHLIFIEAKATSGWTNKQMNAKMNRLKSIFGEDGKDWKHVVPHFALLSPKRPLKLDLANIPNWMINEKGYRHLKLEMPFELKRATRCDVSGKPNADGGYWTTKKRKW